MNRHYFIAMLVSAVYTIIAGLLAFNYQVFNPELERNFLFYFTTWCLMSILFFIPNFILVNSIQNYRSGNEGDFSVVMCTWLIRLLSKNAFAFYAFILFPGAYALAMSVIFPLSMLYVLLMVVIIHPIAEKWSDFKFWLSYRF